MTRPDSPEPTAGNQRLGLETFHDQPSEEGLSLDRLSDAFAELLGRGQDPYAEAPPEADLPGEGRSAEPEMGNVAARPDLQDESEDHCEVSPRSILEALLFVGHPDDELITAEQVSGLMRGVRPAEIDELVRDLNQQYTADNCPYVIVSKGAGYQLTLRDPYRRVRDKLHGRIRRSRLSPASIEVLAIVAYNESLTAEDVSRLRDTPSGAILSNLVRRQLLRIERDEAHPRKAHYYTTQRFLDLFSLSSLDDLPQSQELDTR